MSSTPTGSPVAGDLDEFAVYDRALTPAVVQDRYQRGTTTTAAVARSSITTRASTSPPAATGARRSAASNGPAPAPRGTAARG